MGIQCIPEIAKTAKHLTVLQRTAGFSMPSNNAPTDFERAKEWFDNRDAYHRRQRESQLGLIMSEFGPNSAMEVSEEERQKAYEERWSTGGLAIVGTFNDLLFNKESNQCRSGRRPQKPDRAGHRDRYHRRRQAL